MPTQTLAKFLLYFISCVIVCINTSCIQKRIAKNISQSTADLQLQVIRASSNFDNIDYNSSISWHDANKLALKQNPRYLTALRSEKNSVKQLKRQWWSIVPRIGAFANVSAGLDNLANISSDDISASLIANLNIPSPFDFYAQRYSIKLQLLSNQLQAEQTRRETIIQLYRLYIRQSTLQRQKTIYLKKRAQLDAVPVNEIKDTLQSLSATKNRLDEQTQILRMDINRLLNTPGKHWKLTGKLPKIRFSRDIKQLKLGENSFGQLGLKQQAIQIELSKLQLRSAKLSRLPTLNLSSSTPPIINTSGSNFNAENIQLFAGLNKSIELSDPFGQERITDTATRLNETRTQLKLQAEQEVSRLKQLQNNFQKLTIDLSEINTEENTNSHSNFEELLAEISSLEHKIQMRWNIERQLEEIKLQLWQWDELQWQ